MRRDAVFGFGLALAAAVLVLHACSLGYVSDDAYISFRYARNLLAGHGLVYNAGERVEGYTNFLWTVLLAGVDRCLPGTHLPEIARTLGVLFGCATVVLVGFLGREVSQRSDASGRRGIALLLAPALLAADSSFAVWTTGGLESPMFACLCTAAALAYVRWTKGRAGPAWSPLLFALASLTRPEGVLLFAVTATFELVRQRGRIEGVVRWSLPFAAVFVPYFLWRWSYYGWLLPNTFYAKVGGGAGAWRRGLHYLAGFLFSHAWFVAPAPLLLLLRRRAEGWAAYLAILVVANAAYVIAVGGDGLYSFRFCTYLAPLFYVLVQEGLARGLERAHAAWLPAAGILAAALNVQTTARTLWLPDSVRWTEPKSEVSFPGTGADHGYLFFDNYFVDRQKVAAQWLEANAAPGAVIAATPAGSIAFHTSHAVIDMLGLADEHIAHVAVGDMGSGRAGHEKGDGAYVLSRQPEYILLGNVAVLARQLSAAEMPAKLVRRSEEEIWASPEFHRDYELVSVKLAQAGLFRWFTFARRKAHPGR
jgi:arabinofuranosyltransferase